MTSLRGTSFRLLSLPSTASAPYSTMRNDRPFKGVAFYCEVKIISRPVRVGIALISSMCPSILTPPRGEYLYTGCTSTSYSIGCTGYAYTNRKRYTIEFIRENDIVSILLTKRSVEFFLNGNPLKEFTLVECTCIEDHAINAFGEISTRDGSSAEFLYTHFAYETKIRLNTLEK